jgi:hypothetical protein
MSRTWKAVVACLAAAGLLAGLSPDAFAAPRPIAASPGGGNRPSHPGGSPGGHYGGHGYHHGHPGGYYPGWGWGWGWGIGFGVPWALGWYGPGWGYPTYRYGPAYGAYGPAYGGYPNSCGMDEDCMRAQFSRAEGQAPSARIPPPAPGPEGGPTQRPLHLNYCDSARAWFPQVPSCPGGWRLVLPEYNR